MYKLILIDKGQAPLQVIKCLMDHRNISLSIAMELVRQNEPVLYESENEQDVLDLGEKLKKFCAVTKIINN
nr:MAG TPA: 50S ribosomal protein L11 [Caudoviricetes sp.]